MIDTTRNAPPVEETPGFIAAWEAPISTERPARPPVEETPGFIAAWEAPITEQGARPSWRTWKRPACEMSIEEAELLNSPYCFPMIDA